MCLTCVSEVCLDAQSLEAKCLIRFSSSESGSNTRSRFPNPLKARVHAVALEGEGFLLRNSTSMLEYN